MDWACFSPCSLGSTPEHRGLSCYYGIDTPSREELIAANLGVEEIAAHIGVDSLVYLTLDGMLNAVPDGPRGFCHACFSGDYPPPPPTDPDKLRFGCGC